MKNYIQLMTVGALSSSDLTFTEIVSTEHEIVTGTQAYKQGEVYLPTRVYQSIIQSPQTLQSKGHQYQNKQNSEARAGSRNRLLTTFNQHAGDFLVRGSYACVLGNDGGSVQTNGCLDALYRGVQ